MDPKSHPAITVTNIWNFIPFILEMKSGQYTSWAELFRIHCRAFQVVDHIDSTIIPPSKPSSSSSSSTSTEADKTSTEANKTKALEFAAWSRLDAIAWTALENIFQDNQSTRAVYLDNKFVSTRLDQHLNISSYCQAMKMLADQLANVRNPVSNQRLVLQLIAGLNESYEGVAMIIQQTTPFPDFYEVRSKLIMEEARKAHQAAATVVSLTGGTSATALTISTPMTHPNFGDSSRLNQQQADPFTSRGRGRGRGGRSHERSSNKRGCGTNNNQTQQTYNRESRPYQPWTTPPPWDFPNYTT
ncbi:hypothetical protein Lser_V15G45973 [Lactuca serriola]